MALFVISKDIACSTTSPEVRVKAVFATILTLYTSEIGIIIGPQKDIPAPDVGTNGKVMAWMMDTYSMNHGTTVTGVVTGKPIHLGGSLGREKATGRGVFVSGLEAARRANIAVEGARVAVQGFGKVSRARKLSPAMRSGVWRWIF